MESQLPSSTNAPHILHGEETSPKVSTKTVAIIALAGLLICGLGGAALLQLKPGNFAFLQFLSPADQNAQAVVNLKKLKPLISSCQFHLNDACVTRIGELQLSQADKYQALVRDDMNQVLATHPDSMIAKQKVHVLPLTAQKYFREYQEDVNQREVSVSAMEAVIRVALQYDINPRVLLAMMETQQGRQGPLLSSVENIENPFNLSETSFIGQLDQVANSLGAYVNNHKDQTSTNTLLVFDHAYSVDKTMNPESLAIIQWFADHSPDQQTFEQSVVVFDEQTPELFAPSNLIGQHNFQLTYMTLFNENPLFHYSE